MNQIFLGSIAFIFALILWGIGKKPQKSLQKVSKYKFINNSDINKTSLIYKEKKISNKFNYKEMKEEVWNQPQTDREKIILRKRLFKLIESSPEDRLYAVKSANKWGHFSVLPIIRRGLKDYDSRIVIEAAKGIQKYKEQPSLSCRKSSQSLPLNIFLMR